MNDNNLYDNNITGLLQKLFLHSLNLQFLALFGNTKISGQIPDFDINADRYDVYDSGVVLKRLQYFAAHDCDLYGSLPKNVHIGPDRGYPKNERH